MKRGLVVASVLLIGAAAVAAKHVPDKPIIAARQASMKEMAAAAKLIAGMFNGKVVYDAASFRRASEILRRRAAALDTEFPADTLGPPSAAKPEIEQSRKDFEALANQMRKLTDALAAEAGKAPPDAIPSAMRMGPGMATGGSLLGKRGGVAEDADPSKMPAEHLLHLVLQDCTGCHAKFRATVE